MRTISLEETKQKLIRAHITGPHKSHSRQNNLSNLAKCVGGDPEYCFGVSGTTVVPEEEALGYLARLTGCSDDLNDHAGYDTMDPDKTIAGMMAAARRLRDAARAGATLLTCTGHPTGMLEHYIRIVDAFREAGGKVLYLREDERFSRGRKSREAEIRYVGGVGCFADWGSLKHTHSSIGMEFLLEADPWPDLVLGDHGFAGAAIERGISTIAIMDINDPALAIAWGQGKDVSIVPLDDNRPPRLYEPASRLYEHVIAGADVI
ncbi:MAG: phosphatase [Actinomycetota bacterium]